MQYTTITMRVPTFTKDAYHMNAILIDCMGNTELVDLEPGSIIEADKYFVPCPECGVAILQSAWYEGGNCCARCGISMADSEPTTAEEAKSFLISCVNVCGIGFHPDTLGENYVNSNRVRLFSDDEAEFFNTNMQAVFTILGEDGIYEIIRPILGLTEE